VTAQKERGIRISLGGKYLDETQIRQARPCEARTISFLSFPAHRHWASVTKQRVTISAQAASVVQLYATGILPPIGGPAIALEVDGVALGEWVLDAVESGETSAIDDMIVLQFRRPGQGAP
jgi:hypothetical protein